MQHLRPNALTSTAPDEFSGYRTLAANVLARAVEDLGDPDHAIGAASWLLLEAEGTVWSAWLPLNQRMIRPVVLRAVERVLVGHGAGKFKGRRPRPEHEVALNDLLKRHRPGVRR